MSRRYQDPWQPHGGGYEPGDPKDDDQIDQAIYHADTDRDQR